LHRFFSAFSRPILIDDRDSRVASNVAGSALALIASFCEAFVEANAARAVTLDRAELTAMMAETLGAVSALVQHGYGFAEIVRDTATPGGATEAALGAASTLSASDIVEATFRWQATMQDRMKYPEAG
jgi:competence protein ComER